MATPTKTTLTTPAVSTTGNLQRTVADQIRELWPAASPMLRLTSTGAVKGMGASGEASQEGRIAKRKTSTMKFEWFTFTPIGISVAVASGSDLGPTVTDASGMTVGMTVMNMTNKNVGVIDAIATNALTIVAVGASFTCVAGDRLLFLAPAYKEASTSPAVISKDEDNLYNYVQIIRHAVEIANTAKNSPHYGSEAYFARIKRRSFEQAKRYHENTLLFSERATSEVTATANLGSVYTTRGAVKFAANTFDCNGAMTPEKFRRDLALQLPDSVDPNTELVMFCGRQIFADMNEWYQGKLELQGPGKYKELGLKSYKFITAGPTINVLQHDAFSQAGNQNRAFLFNPEDFAMYYKDGCDMRIKEGIQANDADSQKDELIGTLGFCDVTGGQNTMLIENWGSVGAV
jgi:hypothetical protein